MPPDVAQAVPHVPSTAIEDPKRKTHVSYMVPKSSDVINRKRLQRLLRVRKFRPGRETIVSAQKTMRGSTGRKFNHVIAFRKWPTFRNADVVVRFLDWYVSYQWVPTLRN